MLINVTIGCKRSKPQQGQIHSIESFASDYVQPRRVDVWLPDNFDAKSDYAVLYMHDGQNLFDPELGYGGMIWAVDQALQPLIDQEKVRPTIVVGIWNTPLRFWEYLPAPAFDLLPDSLQKNLTAKKPNKPLSDAYLCFIVEELKPYIDANYPTLSDRDNTLIMGSSMGGLISSYAIASYPEVFGGAGCVSTHWPLSLEVSNLAYSEPYIKWLSQNFPKAGSHRIYFDFGTETLDASYEIHQTKMDSVMQELGYVQANNWMTYKAVGAAHDELSWQKRVHLPLEFLLRN